MSFKERDAVEFKGTGRGLILYINRETSMENIFDSISSKIKSSPNFFVGGILTDIDSNYISPYQKKLIIEFLSENYNIRYVGVDEFHFNEMMKQKEYKGAVAIFKAVRTLYVMDTSDNEEIDYNGSLVFMTTVPAGAIIKASCDIVILGSVEVGAKIIAGGNITVMGEIRGMVYAGAYGNDSACIIARQINAQKIAIFTHESEIVMCKRKTNMSNPEIAYINERGQIVVSQKKEILYKYSPESIKDTSYGAFDVEEQGVMMEKNQSFNDLAYEIKSSSGTDRIISKEELEEAKNEDNKPVDEGYEKKGILESIIKKVSESMEKEEEEIREIDLEEEKSIILEKKHESDEKIREHKNKDRREHRPPTIKEHQEPKKKSRKMLRRSEISELVEEKEIEKHTEKRVEENAGRNTDNKVRKNASKIRVVKGDDSVKSSGERKKKKLVDRLKDLLIEEEVDDEEDRLQ